LIVAYFVRNKVSREVKAEAIRLYMEGLSLRVIARKFHVSKESVRQWILKFEEAFAGKELAGKKERPVILLDETKLKRHGRIVCIAVCLDLERREVVSTQCTGSITFVSTANVTREALKTCTNKNPMMIVDHAPWYRAPFEFLSVDYIHKTFGIRNYIERWYRTLKERTKRFYNNFPIRNEAGAILRIGRFLHLFAYWYNHMRPHETFKGRVPSSLS
jgi:putative transposase